MFNIAYVSFNQCIQRQNLIWILNYAICFDNTKNKNIKISSFKSSENIQKKEGGPDRSVSDNQSSSVTLNELANESQKNTVISSFSKEVIH